MEEGYIQILMLFQIFRDALKYINADDLLKLKNIQPKLNDFKKISPEETKEIKGNLPRTECTGTLLSRDGNGGDGSDDNHQDNNSDNSNCTDNKDFEFNVNGKKRK